MLECKKARGEMRFVPKRVDLLQCYTKEFGSTLCLRDKVCEFQSNQAIELIKRMYPQIVHAHDLAATEVIMSEVNLCPRFTT